MVRSGSAIADGPWALGEDEERRHLKYARRVVIKVGTPVVTHLDGGIAIGRISGVVEEIAGLVKRGKEVVLVTSGAIGHGLLRMQGQAALSSSLRDHLSGEASSGIGGEDIDLKAAAAVGQCGLMSMYDMLFREYNLTCAQILVTEEDWLDAAALSQLRITTAELLSIGAIPIVNENDAISMRTLPVIGSGNKIQWDNDEIASLLAAALHADALLILADFDKLYAMTPEGMPTPMATFDPKAALCFRDDESSSDNGSRRDSTRALSQSLRADGTGTVPYAQSRLARAGFECMVTSAEQAISHVRAAAGAVR
jgi:glutamate 5-kinase